MAAASFIDPLVNLFVRWEQLDSLSYSRFKQHLKETLSQSRKT